MPQHIGIVACSAEGAALLGPHGHPEASMHTHSLAKYVAASSAATGRGWASRCGRRCGARSRMRCQRTCLGNARESPTDP